MTVSRRALSHDGARNFIAEHCFPDRVDTAVGLEVEYLCSTDEWSVGGVDHHAARDAASAAGTLPGGSRVTWEPGGQLELSSAPASSAAAAIDAVNADKAAIEVPMAAAGIRLLAMAMEPIRLPERIVHAPRYDAMEAYFDLDGNAGRRMMRATAALQVNLGMGGEAVLDHRWQVAHRIGPAMAAAFANSPLAGGGATGWQSSRMANWFLIDPTRTAPVTGRRAVDAWTTAVLAARVMLIRRGDECVPMTASHLTFDEWLSGGHELGWPDQDDLAYHLTTLFPPVRPRGWFEIRYIDSSEHWDVASLVLTALLDDFEAGVAALDAAGATSTRWTDAARRGATDPAFAIAASRMITVAAEAIESTNPDGAAKCRDFASRFPDSGRSPANDLLDRWRARERTSVAARA